MIIAPLDVDAARGRRNHEGERMGDEVRAKKRKKGRKRKPVAMSPEAEARFTRRMSILLGLIPLPDMTQAETDWLFEQKVRLSGEEEDRLEGHASGPGGRNWRGT